MTLDGYARGTTKTDANGHYKFKPLAKGTYTITPGKTGKTFTPADRTVTIDGKNVTGQNFVGKKTVLPDIIKAALGHVVGRRDAASMWCL